MHGLSDRDAADAVTFDLRWKAACGLPVTAAAFHATTLTYWRRRLAASERPHRVFETVREVINRTGVVAGKTRRALDSTVLDDAVATQDTVTQLVASIRRVARVVPGGAQIVAQAGTCSGHDFTRPGKPVIAWDDPDARAALVDGLVRDALAVLAVIAGRVAGGLVLDEGPADAVGLLALVAGQDVELVSDPDGPGRWRIARKVARDRVISTVDRDARHAHKTVSRRQDGFKAHLAVQPDTGLVTACAVTRAAGAALLAADTTIGPGQSVQVLGDSAYGTGQMLAAISTAGHQPLVKPWPVRPAVEGGFTVDDFTVDDHTGTVTCPAGATRPLNTARQVNFGAACRGCPLRDRCTRSATGKSMRLREYDALARAHRATARAPEFTEPYRRHRPMVERSIAWVTRGARKLRYRGTVKNDAWLKLRATGINLRRLLVLGLRRQSGTWVIS